jgi:hypothetical protein
MARFKQFDLGKVKTISIKERMSKVAIGDFARPFDPSTSSFSDFLDSLPSILVADDFKRVASGIVSAYKGGFPVILMMGAHVIKVGCSPIIIDLMRQGIVTSVAMNSAAAIHDIETALWGVTSEDVDDNLADGTFGMWKETGEFVNLTLTDAAESGIGYGEALGEELIKRAAPHKTESILATGCELNIPVTVHVAIGTDIVHQQPTMNGSATGEMSFRDFKIFCTGVSGLTGGGAVLNVGSAVILPEVFLKALTVVRNTGYDARGFITANFDMLQHYRPRMNVVQRPTRNGGYGYSITGHHEIMIPLLAAAIKNDLKKNAIPRPE